MIYLIVFFFLCLAFWAFLRFVWFYRDPQRFPPPASRQIIAPADGKIIYIKKFQKGQIVVEKLEEKIPLLEITKIKPPFKVEEGWIIGIYMTPLDVHFNYAPLSGVITKIFHFPASFNLPMLDFLEYIKITWLRRAIDLFLRPWRFQNERVTLVWQGDEIQLATVAIADKFVNKIDLFVQEKDQLKVGEKIAFIRRGSQVDVIIFQPKIELLVKVGDQVFGAKTPLCRY